MASERESKRWSQRKPENERVSQIGLENELEALKVILRVTLEPNLRATASKGSETLKPSIFLRCFCNSC